MTNPSRASRAAAIGAAAVAAALVAGAAQAQTPTTPDFRIVYSAGTTSDLFITDTVNPPVALTTGNARDLSPDWSPDGTAIVFQRMSANGSGADLWVVAPDGTGLRQLTRGPAFDKAPRWSPDGTRVAFARRAGNGSSDIYVVNADGSGVTRLTKTFVGEGAPAWSPDGSRIAYNVVTGRRPDSDIWIMKSNGKSQKKLVSTRAVEGEPDFTPDGTAVLFARESGRIPRKPLPLSSPIRYNLDIWSVAPTGGKLTRITTRKGDDYGPRVSPDGTRYAYSVEIGCPAKATCNTEVFIGNRDGVTPPIQITNRTGLDWGADWGPAAAPALPPPAAPPTQ